MPASAKLFDIKCRPLFDFGTGPRNLVQFSPTGASKQRARGTPAMLSLAMMMPLLLLLLILLLLVVIMRRWWRWDVAITHNFYPFNR